MGGTMIPAGKFSRLYVYGIAVFLVACAMAAEPVINPDFPDPPQKHEILPENIQEASGIAASKVNPGYIWVEQDGGNASSLELIKIDGTLVKSVPLKNISNRDWEDIGIYPDPESGRPFIYLAETGDNGLTHAESRFYRFAEPSVAIDTIRNIETINFYYRDGSHNAEAFLVDPVTKDILVIAKSGKPSVIYRIPFPQSITSDNLAEAAGTLPYATVVSATLQPDGKGVVIKTYGVIYFYFRKPGETILKALSREPIKLSYFPEPVGEAITFANDNSGYYTLSEKCYTCNSVYLYFYKRK